MPNGISGLIEQLPGALADVHQITTSIHGNDISVWVVTAGNQLHYYYGSRTSTDAVAGNITWNPPMEFANDVLTVASMRSQVKSANELFVLNSSLATTHYWQDPMTSSWRSRVSAVAQDDFVVDTQSYTTHAHFANNGLPIPQHKLTITSSEWQYCTINGLVYSLDADVAAEIIPDPQGNVTIISSAVDLSPAIFHVQSKFFRLPLDLAFR